MNYEKYIEHAYKDELYEFSFEERKRILKYCTRGILKWRRVYKNYLPEVDKIFIYAIRETIKE